MTIPKRSTARLKRPKSDCPSRSRVSVKSDRSKDHPIKFKSSDSPVASRRHGSCKRVGRENCDCPSPSRVSLKSDHSKDHPVNFKSSDSPVASRRHGSFKRKKSDASRPDGAALASVLEMAEKKLLEFVSSEMKRIQKALTDDDFDVYSLEGRRVDSEDDASVDSEEEVSVNGEDDASVNGEDDASVDSEDDDSVNSEEEVSVNGEDDASVDSEEEVSVNSEDEVSVNGEDDASVDSEDDDSVNSEDEVSVNGEADDSVNSETDNLDEWRKPRENFLDLFIHFLKEMKQEHLADSLRHKLFAPGIQCQLKTKFKRKFQHVIECPQTPHKSTPLNEVYTELHIIEGKVEISVEHEITQIQTRPPRAITILKSTDIFSPHGRGRNVRTVLTKGVAGIGKTVLTQKFSLDWAEGISNQNIHFIFPFTFRELNHLRGESISLYGLIGHFFPETNQGICRFEEFQCLFIFDGLDECRLEMDFSKAQCVTDVREKVSVEVLLVNIIRGTLLPSALIWITSRPAAASQIPAVCVDMVTEVRGFTDPQKEIYFKKKFRDEEQASKVISHVKASRSVHNMCTIPVFSWITANVMDHILQTEEGTLPQTLTELYIHFLVVQAKVTNVKYKGKSETDHHWSTERRTTVMLLSKLAFEQILKGNLIFYESDLTDCGIDITEASVYSGLFSQMFKEERGLYQNKVFSFVHLSVQEFLAALHVHVTLMESGVDLLLETSSSRFKHVSSKSFIIKFYKTGVDKALESPNGHLDLFLRFLLGLSLQSNQSLLRGLVRQTGSSQINKETAEYLKTLLDSGLSLEKNLTLLQCLNELKDSGLCEEARAWLSSETIPSDLSPAQWSALVYILSEEPEIDPSKYQLSETNLLMLMPVVKQSTKAQLSGCSLSGKSCRALASVLSSQCSLRELDLSNNLLNDSSLQLLCDGLKNSNCALHTLSLRQCGLSSASCRILVSVLDSGSSSLTELDLSNNDLLDSGVKTLCSALQKSCCKIEVLSVSGCQVSKSGCASLVSALSSGDSCLKELDLSYNHPGKTEAEQLTSLFHGPHKKLSLKNGGKHRLQDGFRKYACHLTFDQNTAHKKIKVYRNSRRIKVKEENQPYPYRSERFSYFKQILCSESLSGRKYWEVERSGTVSIAVTYKSIKRRGDGDESLLGKNAQSWSLRCSETAMSIYHHNTRKSLKVDEVDRIGVYLDCDSGILSFYDASSEQKIHLHTIKTSFTEEVYAAFRLSGDSELSLCPSDEDE